MADVDTGIVVSFPALGRQTSNVTQWEIDSSYFVSADGFSFLLNEEETALLDGLEFHPVDLSVNGAPQVAGRIDKTTRGDNAKLCHCEGRDYIADIVECNVDPLLKVSADDTLEVALRKAMTPCGVTVIIDASESVALDTRLGRPARKKKGKGRKSSKLPVDYKPKPGEGIYEFCKRITDRLGTTMQPDLDRGTLILSEPDYAQAPWYELRRSTDATTSVRNNIVSATAVRDYSSFPTYALFTGIAPKPGKTGGPLDSEFNLVDWVETEIQGKSLLPQMRSVVEVAVSGRRTDKAPQLPAGKIYRLLYQRDQDARSVEQIDNAIFKAIAELLKDSLVYTATVRGHVDPESGAIWTVNTMVDVKDEVAGVNEPLWIAKRTLRYSPSDGATTELEMYRPGSFIISPEA